MKAVIDLNACDRRQTCGVIRICPKGAVKPVEGGAFPGANGFVIDEARCSGCGICMRACPMGAVQMK